MISIRPAVSTDANDIWEIIRRVIVTGDTYAFSPNASREEMLEYWLGPDRHPYVAVIDNKIAGTFVMKPNQPGLGSHIANGAYMTSPDFRSRGVGKTMGEYSITEAKRLGYIALQFNIVVKSNTVAVNLWKSLGFEVIGEIPDAFRHQTLGLTNAYILYRKV